MLFLVIVEVSLMILIAVPEDQQAIAHSILTCVFDKQISLVVEGPSLQVCCAYVTAFFLCLARQTPAHIGSKPRRETASTYIASSNAPIDWAAKAINYTAITLTHVADEPHGQRGNHPSAAPGNQHPERCDKDPAENGWRTPAPPAQTIMLKQAREP
ncbi:MAG: hypothetical protein HHJ16_11185 [Polaromonas sp.]|uniref:hypothetical protein n=1 Tax=Polaromonas sp. TaxID=1869339 RepID=UPI001799B9D9|nr:hypothetical protein [Polaromonas sp.]NMM10825.1 hypothetical protein [Polaromonas sp.]